MNRMMVVAAAVAALTASNVIAGTDDPVMTYQGQLSQGGELVSETCDLIFSLWDDEQNGSMVGDQLFVNGVAVVNGVFTVELAFPPEDLQGGALWLQTSVRCPSGAGIYSTLQPRQGFGAAPYALRTRGLTVDSSERVGIGTMDPSRLLHLFAPSSDGLFIESGTGYPSIALASASSEDDHRIMFTVVPTSGSMQLRMGQGPEGVDGSSDTRATFHPNGDLSVEGALETGGYIGINTSPERALHIQSNDAVGSTLRIDRTSIGAWDFGPTSNGSDGLRILKTTSTDPVLFLTISDRVGIGTDTPGAKLHVVGDIVADGSCNCSSDARLKTRIETVDHALSRVQALHGVFFEWRDRPDEGRQLGVVAQEVREVVPEVVQQLDNGMHTVAYGQLAALNIEAIKELADIVESQARLIESLETRIAELEASQQ